MNDVDCRLQAQALHREQDLMQRLADSEARGEERLRLLERLQNDLEVTARARQGYCTFLCRHTAKCQLLMYACKHAAHQNNGHSMT